MTPSIPLHLSDEDDSDSNKRIIDMLQSVVDGTENPISGARIIHDVVVNECRQAYISYTSTSSLEAGQMEGGVYSGPDGWMKFLWNCIGKAAIRIPASHEGQDRLVSLLRELHQLPKTSVPRVLSGEVTEKVLWDLTKETGYENLV
ncbi:uncharacterized protein F4822DRAFT_426534 [Hypoxylon trugodes]|uniref:uncharacterized protein n=1 Tax=Hypoxylon trugodes TaxID=326681 RepID=UPI0021982CD9|nr:uncharacterized protein F4822DRAFT_426534 [Hypoxylon trugodes]KAI1390685.1 hypothetical protein F4822DRAFT_426534 [Hypoxylon trugodes]